MSSDHCPNEGQPSIRLEGSSAGQLPSNVDRPPLQSAHESVEPKRERLQEDVQKSTDEEKPQSKVDQALSKLFLALAGFDSTSANMRQERAHLAKESFSNQEHSSFGRRIAQKRAAPQMPTIIKKISFQEGQKRIQAFVKGIFRNQSRMGSMMSEHETDFQRLWAKKTVEQRRQLLQTVWCGIPSKHRPDYEALNLETRHQRLLEGTKYRDWFLLPHLNLEDLSRARTLVLLVDSRIRYPPADFVRFDSNSVHVGVKSMAIIPPIIPECTILLSGQIAPADYGKLLPWKDHPTAKDMIQDWRGMTVSDGLLVLEIQARTLEFLIDCVETVLSGKLTPSQNDILQSIPQPRPTKSLALKQSPTLLEILIEDNYGPPPRFDFFRLEDLIYTKRAETIDRWWSLREDPKYFQEIMLGLAACQFVGMEAVYDRVIGLMYESICLWELAWQAVSRVIRPSPAEPYISPASVEAMYSLSFVCEKILSWAEVTLFQCVGRWLEQMPLQTDPSDESSCSPECSCSKTSADNAVEDCDEPDPLQDLLKLIVDTDSDSIKIHHLNVIVHEIEFLFRSDPKQRVRIPRLIAESISEVACVFQVFTQAGLSRPERLQGQSNMEVYKGDYKKAYAFRVRMHEALKRFHDFGELGSLVIRPDYLEEQKPTAATVRSQREAEKNLDRFWEMVDGFFLNDQDTGRSFLDACKPIAGQRSLYRTPKWDGPEEATEPQHSPSEPQSSPEPQPPFTQLILFGEMPCYIPLRNPPRPCSAPAPPPPSPSSLPLASSMPPNAPSSPPPSTPPPPPSPSTQSTPLTPPTPPPEVRVSKRAYKTFVNLFDRPSAEKMPDDTPWSEFVRAMTAAGFTAEKLPGSAWLFFDSVPPSSASSDDTPSSSGSDEQQERRRIMIQEPWPGSVMTAGMARRVAGRLEREFGWKGEG
ncbi:MAG: hypothetical protein Q9190_007721, partial [Brigantiaea leucoxantha]